MQPVWIQFLRAIARGSPKYDHVHGVIVRVPAARALPAGGAPAALARVGGDDVDPVGRGGRGEEQGADQQGRAEPAERRHGH